MKRIHDQCCCGGVLLPPTGNKKVRRVCACMSITVHNTMKYEIDFIIAPDLLFYECFKSLQTRVIFQYTISKKVPCHCSGTLKYFVLYFLPRDKIRD